MPGAKNQISDVVGPGMGKEGMQKRARGFIRVIKTCRALIVVVDTQRDIYTHMYTHTHIYTYIYMYI